MQADIEAGRHTEVSWQAHAGRHRQAGTGRHAQAGMRRQAGTGTYMYMQAGTRITSSELGTLDTTYCLLEKLNCKHCVTVSWQAMQGASHRQNTKRKRLLSK